MKRSIDRWVVGLAALAASLAAVASAAGIFLRGDLATERFTTVRGDDVEILVGGIYRFNGVAIAAEGVGWDIVTLFVAVPALLLALPGLWRGSLRATLFALGLLVYLTYQYVEYATFLAYGPIFLVYVAAFSTAMAAIGLSLSRLDLVELAGRVGPGFPRRAVAGFGVFMAILLCGMWLPLIGRSLDAAQVPQLEGGTTLVVQAFDLGVLVPLGLFTAVAVWRRLPVGYVLAAIVVTKGATMGAAIAAMLIVEALVTGEAQLIPTAMFILISLVSIAIAVRVYGSVGASSSRDEPSGLRLEAGRP